jgi:hypothetical protein
MVFNQASSIGGFFVDVSLSKNAIISVDRGSKDVMPFTLAAQFEYEEDN